MKLRTGAAVALVIAGLTVLAACSPAAEEGAPSKDASPSASAPSSPEPSESSTPTPTTPPVELPTDCRKILTSDVLAQLKDVPLNDEAFGPAGVMPNGDLQCNWADPRADTTALMTTISHMNRGPALDLLNHFVEADGYTCYTPDEGTRCEKTWKNETYPVTDGRTLYWRDGVMIDTQYSNLAPSGYTNAIVAAIWG